MLVRFDTVETIYCYLSVSFCGAFFFSYRLYTWREITNTHLFIFISEVCSWQFERVQDWLAGSCEMTKIKGLRIEKLPLINTQMICREVQ